MHFILYGTLGCHLCELAEAQLAALLMQLPNAAALEIECIDIADGPDSDELISRYGERIPVLRRGRDAAEMSWPFEDIVLREFLRDGIAR